MKWRAGGGEYGSGGRARDEQMPGGRGEAMLAGEVVSAGKASNGVKQRGKGGENGGRASAASWGPCPVQGSLALGPLQPVSAGAHGDEPMECGGPGCSWAGRDGRGHSELLWLPPRGPGGSWRGAQQGLSLPDTRPQRRPHSPRSGMWRTMFPATPSSSTWHGLRVVPWGVRRGPTLASWGSRWRKRRHMTGGTGRGVGAPRCTLGSQRAWSRAAAGPGGAGARAGGGEGSSRARRRKRTRRPGRRRGGGIFLAGGGRTSAQGPPGTLDLQAGGGAEVAGRAWTEVWGWAGSGSRGTWPRS